MTRLALILLACSDAHVPHLNGALDGDGCGRVAVAEYIAGAECVRLESTRGALFQLSTSESCGGPPCIIAKPGETAYALELATAREAAEWTVEAGTCAELEQCCGDYLVEFQCWE